MRAIGGSWKGLGLLAALLVILSAWGAPDAPTPWSETAQRTGRLHRGHRLPAGGRPAILLLFLLFVGVEKRGGNSPVQRSRIERSDLPSNSSNRSLAFSKRGAAIISSSIGTSIPPNRSGSASSMRSLNLARGGSSPRNLATDLAISYLASASRSSSLIFPQTTRRWMSWRRLRSAASSGKPQGRPPLRRRGRRESPLTAYGTPRGAAWRDGRAGLRALVLTLR